MIRNTPSADFFEQIKSVVGPRGWTSRQNAERYFTDQRARFVGDAALVVLPKTTGQVSAVVALCNSQNVGIIPFGGGTGASAGHLDFEGQNAIVLSLERMDAIRSIDIETETITVEAGCILANIQSAADQIERRFGLSLASEGSCTIGGNLASNAGGIQVLRYGNARDMCLGIEAVLADGAILNDLRPLRKDNTGFDLRNLLIGSEGTLGIITAATLKLVPRPQEITTFITAFRSPDCALALLHSMRSALGDSITAFELMSQLSIKLATKYFKNLRDPFNLPYPWYAVVDVEGHRGTTKLVDEVLTKALEAEIVIDAVVAQSDTQRQSIWNLREFAFEYNMKEGAFCSSDTAVPIGEIGNFIQMTDAALAELDPNLRANRYGHLGDGNIHVNVFPPEGVSKSEYLRNNANLRDDVHILINSITEACRGTVSAEHGIGRLKRAALLQFGDPTKIATMRAIKKALDPHNIMNPGALFTDELSISKPGLSR
ncbi:MAG: FAD-binding oxidoreductase [Aestuariivita sp.]|nr:FAD-binding oxidoreductase [Aestuariivita sp.]